MFKKAYSDKTRNNGYKQVVQLQKGPRKHFFPARVTNAWNALSSQAVSAKTADDFKTELKREWKNHPDRFSYRFSY